MHTHTQTRKHDKKLIRNTRTHIHTHAYSHTRAPRRKARTLNLKSAMPRRSWFISCTHTHTHADTHIDEHTHTHTYTYTHTGTRIHTHTHTHKWCHGNADFTHTHWWYANVHTCTHTGTNTRTQCRGNLWSAIKFHFLHPWDTHYGVATMRRLLKIIGLFCRIQSQLQGFFAKETYNFKEPTNRSYPKSVVN